MKLHAGITEIQITPPVGVDLAGYSFGPSQGVLDELEAEVLFLESGALNVVIITADLLTFGNEFVTALRQRVEIETGIPGSHVMLCASHTHSGPTTMHFRKWGSVDENYVKSLEVKLAKAVYQAMRNAEPVQLSTGVGKVLSISENRRGIAEKRDNSVPLIRLDRENGKAMGILYAFGCHPVSLHNYQNLYSPDYPGYTRSTVRAVLGEDTRAMFILGAAGDINPKGYIPRTMTPEDSWRMGAILGCEVVKAALEAQSVEEPFLKYQQEKLELPIVNLPSARELENLAQQYAVEAEKLRAENASNESLSVIEISREWAMDGVRAWQTGGLGDCVNCEVSAIRLGDAVLFFAPLELFSDTGLAIKAASPAKITLLGSNANGALGYLPTLDAYTTSDYTNPDGLAPKVYGVHSFSEEAEPIFRQGSIRLIERLFS